MLFIWLQLINSITFRYFPSSKLLCICLRNLPLLIHKLYPPQAPTVSFKHSEERKFQFVAIIFYYEKWNTFLVHTQFFCLSFLCNDWSIASLRTFWKILPIFPRLGTYNFDTNRKYGLKAIRNGLFGMGSKQVVASVGVTSVDPQVASVEGSRFRFLL